MNAHNPPPCAFIPQTHLSGSLPIYLAQGLGSCLSSCDLMASPDFVMQYAESSPQTPFLPSHDFGSLGGVIQCWSG